MFHTGSDEFRSHPRSQGHSHQSTSRRTEMTSTSASTGVGSIGTVIVPVSDQDRAIAFYTEKLGFEKRADVPMGEAMRWVEVAPTGAETSIAIVPPREGEPTGVQTRVAFSTEDVDATHA